MTDILKLTPEQRDWLIEEIDKKMEEYCASHWREDHCANVIDVLHECTEDRNAEANG